MKDGNIGGDSMKKMNLLSGKKSVLNGMLSQIGPGKRVDSFIFLVFVENFLDVKGLCFHCEVS